MGSRPVAVLQDEVVLVSCQVLAGAVTADDVGVVEQLAALVLAVEAIDVALVAGEAVGKHLERHLLAQLLVIGEVDRSHATLAESAQNPELAESAQFVRRIGRRTALRLSGVKPGSFQRFHRRQVPARLGRGERNESTKNVPWERFVRNEIVQLCYVNPYRRVRRLSSPAQRIDESDE